MASLGAAGVARFGGFEFDLSSRELRKGRTRIGVPDQSLVILAMLVEHPGELVTRDAIQSRLWPHGTVVEFEHSVNSAVNRLRQALLDTASTPRFVETLPRKGYRFIGTLELPDGQARLKPGTIISHYRILAEAGRGAMGVVYKAEDTTLGRMVALKFLPDELATHPPALERLRREARMIATLNNPGICTMYELGEASGRVFLVMEFLEGESLREHMTRTQLSQNALIEIAVQVAKALEGAHARGMVHRDIKPDNLFLTKQGVVKLMDFGLAKLVEEENAESPQSSLTGTPGYMSPEQVRGEALDARSDIYSMGKVLEELAGESPPKSLAPILRKALAGDPAKRWQSAGELHEALDTARRQRWPRTLLMIGLSAGALVVVTLGWFLDHRSPKPPAELTQKRLTFSSSEYPVDSEAISPDGKYLAYSDRAGIHVKLLSTSEEQLIRRPSGVPAGADWSVDSWFPDGTQLLADTGEPDGQKSIWTVSVLGQSRRQLREGASGLEVSPDGTHVVFSPLEAQPGLHRDIWMMGIQGDNPQKVIAFGEHELQQGVSWSPDGQRLAYIRMHSSSNSFQQSIETCDLRGANRTVVVSGNGLALEDFCWLPEGRIVFSRQDSPGSSDDNLWQVGIENHAGTPTSQPKRITQWAGSRLRGVRASADGKRLVLVKQTFQSEVYVGELSTGGTRMTTPRRLTNEEAWENLTAWTPDSKSVLFASSGNGKGIYKQEISQETSEPMITGPVIDLPRLSADGAWILYREGWRTPANPNSQERLMRIPASGGVPRFVMDMRTSLNLQCARAPASLCIVLEPSQDRKQLVITAFDPLNGRGKVLRTIERDPNYRGLIGYYHSALSPDGSTFAISRLGDPEIHIRLLSLSAGSDREITVKGWPNNEGLEWSSDGKGLYCGSGSSQGVTLLYVNLKADARVLWHHNGGDVGQFLGVPSPDGRYIAIQVNVINSNVWMLEGF